MLFFYSVSLLPHSLSLKEQCSAVSPLRSLVWCNIQHPPHISCNTSSGLHAAGPARSRLKRCCLRLLGAKYFPLAAAGVAPSCDRALLVVVLHLQRDIKAEVTARSLRSIELYCFPDWTIRTFLKDAEGRRPRVCQRCVLPHIEVIRWLQLNRWLIESLCHKVAVCRVHLWFAIRIGNGKCLLVEWLHSLQAIRHRHMLCHSDLVPLTSFMLSCHRPDSSDLRDYSVVHSTPCIYKY